MHCLSQLSLFFFLFFFCGECPKYAAELPHFLQACQQKSPAGYSATKDVDTPEHRQVPMAAPEQHPVKRELWHRLWWRRSQVRKKKIPHWVELMERIWDDTGATSRTDALFFPEHFNRRSHLAFQSSIEVGRSVQFGWNDLVADEEEQLR